ncbi:MAG: response regulator transcription factor [Flavobacteriales bacterium]|nr:response regulator transcription factor [Flavobacteriales bacterium]
MEIRAMLIDDEPAFRADLRAMLQRLFPEVQVVAEAGSVPEGVERVLDEKPDLLFLDVEMGALNGFDLLRRIEPFRPQVIFTTGHKDFAVHAIRVNALDYLLKPIDEEELNEAVLRVFRAIRESRPTDRIGNLLGSIKNGRPIALPVSDGFDLLPVEEILYCESDDNYTRIHTRDQAKPILISRTLKEVDDYLADRGFVRIHQSFLVNLHHAVHYQRGSGGELRLSNGKSLPVSKRQKQVLLDALDLMQGRNGR